MVSQKDQEEKDKKAETDKNDPKAVLHELCLILLVSHIQSRNYESKESIPEERNETGAGRPETPFLFDS